MTPTKSLAFVISYTLVFILGWFANTWLAPLLPPSPADKNVLIQPQPRTAIVVYENDAPPNIENTMRINKVTLIQHNSRAMMLEVDYFYSDPIPPSEIKLFTSVDSSLVYFDHIKVHTGVGKSRTHISLNETRMNENTIQSFDSSEIRISFEHYPPGAYKGVLHKTLIPFQKHWSLH
jgi:hypothetical protein